MKIIEKKVRMGQLYAVMFAFSPDRHRCLGLFTDPLQAQIIAKLPIGKEGGTGYVQETLLELDQNNQPVKTLTRLYPTAVACACDNLTYNKCREFNLLPD